MKKKLIVIPSDPIAEYEKQGLYFLKEYYNPGGFFDEVYALSPYEKVDRFAYGMHIMHIEPHHFAKQVRKIMPNVVRAYGGYWACDLACKNKIPGIPVVVSVHDTNPDLLYPSVKKADLVICVSRVVADLVATRRVPKDKIRLLPNRIDLDVFHPLENPDYTSIQKLGLPDGKHILCVGRQTEQKNIDTLIRAMAYLPEEYSLIMIGGDDRGLYENLAKELNVISRCFWLHFVPNKELPLWHSWADCFCVPSRWEGFGFVFIEAAACGNAVITSNIAPMNEYLTHDISACLVDNYETPDAVATAIRKVCEDTTYRTQIINGGIAVGEKFGRTRVDELEITYYSEVLSFSKKSNRWNFLSKITTLLRKWFVL